MPWDAHLVGLGLELPLARPVPLADHVPLELGQGGEDVEIPLATAGGGVDLLGEALEADPSPLKTCHRLDRVRKRSPEAIQRQTTTVSPLRA